MKRLSVKELFDRHAQPCMSCHHLIIFWLLMMIDVYLVRTPEMASVAFGVHSYDTSCK